MSERVLLVVGTVAGGAGRHVHDLAAGLVERGHTVTVACPTSVGEQFDFGGVGARVERIEIAERPSPTRDARTMRVLRRMTKVADVVHAHGVRAGALACLATKATPVVVTLHNARPTQSGLSGVAFDTLERVVARQANVVLCVSSDLVQRVRDDGAKDVRLAVVPATPWSGSTDVDAVRHEFGDAPMVLVVGRLAPQKRIDHAIDVALHVQQVRPDVHWLIAGEGPERESLQARIDESGAPVRLLGHRADVHDLLAAAQVVVSTAQWEGQPVWLQEALQAGRAIVATEVGGTADVVADAAVLVPFGEIDTLQQKVTEMLDDAGLRSEFEGRALERATQLPTESDALDEIEKVYRGLSAENNA
ncbi:glycosyltransferase family 4 protein [Yimella sp. cx-51]|uniref:glycosyltransferase family 4 protein n=1 Tax=Yimella sp. cx-51 TaxID=2770551 RepID=UPI00165D9089|nr:glycosyltransferase family 4 protein [Yimella sp. cx-51]MBC9957546.1 glycosyltransferase family 4 protein [Yimella sp. cx-51]QTH39230.1 glycosyltransferase family 4 protein [Yimella sp. cx-51]